MVVLTHILVLFRPFLCCSLKVAELLLENTNLNLVLVLDLSNLITQAFLDPFNLSLVALRLRVQLVVGLVSNRLHLLIHIKLKIAVQYCHFILLVAEFGILLLHCEQI